MDSNTAIATPVGRLPWGLLLLEGIAALLIGILLITQPGATLFTIVLFVGAYWFVSGVIDLVMLFVDQTQWGWRLFSGVIGILAGLALLRHPAWASLILPATLAWLLGIAGVVIGAIWLARAFTGGGWEQGILAVISILLGLLLLANPLYSSRVLLYAVAIWAMFGGIVAIVTSLWVRSRAAGAPSRAGRPVQA